MKKLLCVLLTLFVIQGYSQRRVPVDELITKGWYEDGQLKFEGALFNGVGFDVYEDGQLKLEANYKDGKNDGLYQEWYENGQLKFEINSKDGKFDGIVKSWYENGQLASEVNHKDGQRDGLYQEWYENGQLASEGNYKDGEKDGLWKGWSQKAEMIRNRTYYHIQAKFTDVLFGDLEHFIFTDSEGVEYNFLFIEDDTFFDSMEDEPNPKHRGKVFDIFYFQEDREVDTGHWSAVMETSTIYKIF